MKECLSANIRNIALVGHGSSGKTMIGESMLACSGVINRLGHIATGNTVSDFYEEEQKHQHSIYTSLLSTHWHDKKFNILDTPGYADFIGEALGALRVADLAAIVINSENGIELGTENAWENATNNGLAKLFILNALDKENIQFETVMQQLRAQFGAHVVPLTVPVSTGPGFKQVIDVLHRTIIAYKGDEIGTADVTEPSGELKERTQQLYHELVECIAESDDALLEKFFEHGDLEEQELTSALHRALQNQSLIPAFAVCAEHNIGITPMMDFLASYGSNPLDHARTKALSEKDEEIELTLTDPHPSLFIFKTVSESKSGGLSFFKVTSGDVKPGINLYNSARNTTERVGQLFTLNGKNRTPFELFHAGDIGAVAKLKDTHTNNTLSDTHHVVTLNKVTYPHPNMHIAIRSLSKGDEEKLAIGLATLREEDPTFSYSIDPELHQMIITGQGELHLETCVEKLRHRFGLTVETYQPRVAYRETIKTAGDAKYRHKKQSGGAGQFAEVWMRVSPKSHNEEVEFTQSLVGQNVDRVFVPSVEKGVKAASQQGALAGYKIVGVKVDFYDGKQHPVDSKDIAFQIAGKHAFREAFLSAKPGLLEPISLINVKVPTEFTGDIMSDLSSRRGKILGIDSEGMFTVIKAHVPQADLYRYATTLRSLVGGRGVHTEAFSHYEEMPHELEQRIIAQSKATLTHEVED